MSARPIRPIQKEEICTHPVEITNTVNGQPQPPICENCGPLPKKGK